jgi:hypothetical protein
MPAWKVLLVGLFGVVCLALTMATIVVPLSKSGGGMWAWWLGGLFVASLATGTLFVLFLRHAGAGLANHL